MKRALAVLIASLPLAVHAEIHRHEGRPDALPHEKYVRVVSEAESPLEQIYVKSKDGVYVAAAIRRPKGDGPFPAIILFHGAPGGRNSAVSPPGAYAASLHSSCPLIAIVVSTGARSATAWARNSLAAAAAGCLSAGGDSAF